MPDSVRRRRTRWVVAAVVVVLAAAAVVTYAATRGDDLGASRGWGERWPLRGDLAGDDGVLRDAVGGLPGHASDPHILWAGTVGSVRHVEIAFGDGSAYDLAQAGGRWRATRLAATWDPSGSLLPVPLMAPASGATYLVAADARLTALTATASVPVTAAPMPVTDGVARHVRTPEASAVDRCRGWVVQADAPAPTGTLFYLPWEPAGRTRTELERASRDVDRATAIAAGVSGYPDCPTEPLLQTGTWQISDLAPHTPAQLIAPGHRDGWVLLTSLRRGDAPATTIMFLPKDGTAAIFGTPIAGEPHSTLSNYQFATTIRGLAPTPAVLAYCACRVVADPPLPVLAANPPGGATLLGPPPAAVTLTYLDTAGKPLATQRLP